MTFHSQPDKWGYTYWPLQMVAVRLACGHMIEATENDGGMDEVPNVTRRLLEDTVRRRVVTHAIVGCVR